MRHHSTLWITQVQKMDIRHFSSKELTKVRRQNWQGWVSQPRICASGYIVEEPKEFTKCGCQLLVLTIRPSLLRQSPLCHKVLDQSMEYSKPVWCSEPNKLLGDPPVAQFVAQREFLRCSAKQRIPTNGSRLTELSRDVMLLGSWFARLAFAGQNTRRRMLHKGT